LDFKASSYRSYNEREDRDNRRRRDSVVELDETHICKRKYNVGRVGLIEAVWKMSVEYVVRPRKLF